MATPLTTKDGKPKKPRPNGAYKATATAHRLHIRAHTWEPIRAKLQAHLQACKSQKGEASRIAKYLGTSPSQIHRWSCPVCEHDNEPNFSQGFALMIYLNDKQLTKAPTISYAHNHPAMSVTRA